MKYLWRALTLLVLGGIGWGAWYLATHPEWGEAPSRKAQPSPSVRAKSLTITGWQRRGDRAEKLWQVTAHDVREGGDGRGQWFRQITDGILFRDGRPIARFRAGQGQGDQAQNVLSIRGGAHVTLEGDGTTLATEEVHWRGPQRQLWLPRPVQVTRRDLHLSGANAHLDLRLGRLTSDKITGSSPHLRFQARRGMLLLKERRLELSPVTLQTAAGEGRADRVVYFAEQGRFQAQEVHMKLTISPAAVRAAAATGLTLALLTAAGGAPAPEKKPRPIDIAGDTLTDTKQEMVVVNAVITDRDTKVTADRMVVFKDAEGKTERIVATGSPRAVNERNEVTGEKMTVYPKERRVVVEEKVRVVVRPKPGEPEPEKKDVRGQFKDSIITADRIEYDYRNKNVAAEGNLKIASRGRTVTGEKVFYTDKTEQAEFFGKVHARDEKGQTFETATGLKLDLKKGAEGLHVPGKFTATLYVDEDEEEPAAAPTESKPDKSAAAPNSPPATEKAPPAEKKAP